MAHNSFITRFLGVLQPNIAHRPSTGRFPFSIGLFLYASILTEITLNSLRLQVLKLQP
jgi:hypothetical protein